MKNFIIVFLLLLPFINGCNQQTTSTQKLDENLVRVGIMATDWPKSISPDTDFVVKTKIINVGDVTLPSLGKDGYLLKVGVSYHWRLMDEKIVVWDGHVSSLKHDLKKNEEQIIDLAIKSPPDPGIYILEIDLLQNSAFWFGGTGSQTARISINVK
jgi:hypothetical protein